MKTRLLIIIGIIAIVAGTVYFTYENSIDTNEIGSSQFVSGYNMTFSAGNMTFHEELCIKNEGKWVNYQYDSKCYFETLTKLNLAETAFEEAGKTKITGVVAKNVCAILDIPCPEDPKFDAWLDRDEGTASFTFYKNQERFTFLINDTEIRYMTDAQNGWKIFDDTMHESDGFPNTVMSFGSGNVKFYESWCIQNDGVWVKTNQCHFGLQTTEAYDDAKNSIGELSTLIDEQEVMTKYTDAVKNNVSLGSFKIKDVIAGFGVKSNSGISVSMLSDVYYSDNRDLLIDELWKYFGSEVERMTVSPFDMD